MMFNYGFSIAGKSHVANNTCCQDAHAIKEIDKETYIAVIADGVGSAENSAVGANIAVNAVVSKVVEKYHDYKFDETLEVLLKGSYKYAFEQISKESQKNNKDICSYDTTLSAVIFNGKNFAFGHSGDGGIVGLTNEGKFKEITKPQKGADLVSVIPLRFGEEYWEFGFESELYVSVLLLTDGLLAALCPYLLRLNDDGNELYIPLASYLADPFGFNDDSQDSILKSIEDFLKADPDYILDGFYKRLRKIYKARVPKHDCEIIEEISLNHYPIALVQDVQDDKTAVVLANTEISECSQPENYYKEPNWDDLLEKWNKLAYPQLAKNREIKNKEQKTNEQSDTSVTESSDASIKTIDSSEVKSRNKAVKGKKHRKPKKEKLIEKIGDVVDPLLNT